MSQYRSASRSENEYEIKVGAETIRFVPSLGLGRNFYFTKNISLSPELLVIGTPILGGTFRINIPVTRLVNFSMHAGLGLTPVGFPFSAVGITGVNMSYKISNQIYLFIEPRIYFFPEDIISAGTGFFGINDLNKNNPFVITVGVGL